MTPRTPRLARIEAAIKTCNDKKLLRLLYRAWYAEVMSVYGITRRAA
jgi:hypothetical protein